MQRMKNVVQKGTREGFLKTDEKADYELSENRNIGDDGYPS